MAVATAGFAVTEAKEQPQGHHVRQPVSVRTLTPSHGRWARAGVIPACRAVTKTTTAPGYTRRPRERTEGGVVRRRQPS